MARKRARIKASRRILLFMLLILAIPALAYAHPGNTFASTPVTPPRGWLWVLPLFLVASVACDWFAMRKTVSRSNFILVQALDMGWFLIVMFLMAFCLQLIWYFIPLSLGFGLPSRPFLGESFAQALPFFIIVNLFPLGMFLYAKRRMCLRLPSEERPSRRWVFVGSIAVYFLALLPFISSNALTHGWTGRRARMECISKLHYSIGGALTLYADDHGGHLPDARTTADVLEAIKPYTAKSRWPSEESLSICPAEDRFNREPRPYIWNASFSGVRIDESGKTREDEPVLTCPFDHPPLCFGGVKELKARLAEEAGENKP